MSELDQLAAALARAQAELKPVPKTGKNPHLKNEYATLDDIIGAVRGPLGNHGLSFVQLLGGNGSGVTLRTILLHESGQLLESTVLVDAGEGNRGVNALQALGSAITYMKRYALSAMLGIATDGDTDGEGAPATAGKPLQRRQEAGVTPGSRPLDGPTGRATIRKKADWLAAVRNLEGEPITQAQVKGVAGVMEDAIRTDGMNQQILDRARHDVLYYLVGVTETLKLTKAEASAIISWLKADDSWELNEHARAEAQAVLKALAQEKEKDLEDVPFAD